MEGERFCSFPGCTGKYLCKGWCRGHYDQVVRRHQEPAIIIRNKGQLCKVKECFEDASTKGFCKSHYGKFHRHGNPFYERQLKHGAVGYERGCRCTVCIEDRRRLWEKNKQERYSSEPPEHGTTSAYWNWGCRCDLCSVVGSSENRLRRFKNLLGLSLEEVENLLALQEYQCYICSAALTLSKSTHLDHDHSCCPSGNNYKLCGNCSRAFLCQQCNWALGLARESVTILEQARKYLLSKESLIFYGKNQRILKYPDKPRRLEKIHEQDNRCLICYEEFDLLAPILPCLDHNHSCCPGQDKKCGLCYRGFLCSKCNRLLGNVKEDLEIINSMICYIKNPPRLSNGTKNEV